MGEDHMLDCTNKCVCVCVRAVGVGLVVGEWCAVEACDPSCLYAYLQKKKKKDYEGENYACWCSVASLWLLPLNFLLPQILRYHRLKVVADVNSSQNTFLDAWLWVTDRSRYLACLIFHTHCTIVTLVSEHRFAFNFGHLPAISTKNCWRRKIRDTVVQCVPGIRVHILV